MQDEALVQSPESSRTRSIAFCGLCVALMAVCAWITVPFGPVPFTLQTFAMVFAFLALRPKEALGSIALYLVMGAIGLPVFSSMRGGVGVIAGPTGGFLWGFLAGALVAILFLKIMEKSGAKRSIVVDAIAAILFLAICYLCGWVQLAAVAQMSMAAAFFAAIAPFIIVDAVKLAVAIVVARAVRNALKL